MASYNRGMRLLTAAGGVRATVVDDRMQRAPVFVFDDALEAARSSGPGCASTTPAIAAAAESTTSVGRLLRDRAVRRRAAAVPAIRLLDRRRGRAEHGGRATLAACEWIVEHHPVAPRFMLSGGIDTDKKHSALNALQTRGKRVVAEVTLPPDLLREHDGRRSADPVLGPAAEPDRRLPGPLVEQRGARGQRRSRRCSSPPARTWPTSPSRTPRSSTRNCSTRATTTGRSPCPRSSWPPSAAAPAWPRSGSASSCSAASARARSRKLAEICAAVVLAGEISLGCAVLAGDWVSSHERLGRNRGSELTYRPRGAGPA